MVPVRVNPPVAVVLEPKHGVAVLKVKLVTLRPPFPMSVSETVKERLVVPLAEFVSAAVQFPVMMSEFPPEPHPLSANPIKSKRTTPTFFIKVYLLDLNYLEGAMS